MPSVSERSRNNVKAGIFVTIAIIIAIGVTSWLMELEGLVRPMSHYTVFYHVSSGVNNIQEGAEVRVGGVAMGRVEAVRPLPNVQDESVHDPLIDIDFSLDERVHLHSDAVILVSAALVGQDAWLDITDLGGPLSASPSVDATRLESGARIEGGTTSGVLASIFGSEAPVVQSNVMRFTDFIGGIEGRYDNDIKPILHNANITSAEVRMTAERIRKEVENSWISRVDGILSQLENAVGTGQSALEGGQELMANANRIVEGAEQPINDVLMNARIASGDVSAITERVRNQMMDKVDRLVGTSQVVLDDSVSLIGRAQEELDARSVDLEATMGSARLAAQQLELASAELRRSPWKLLYRPSDKELENELLYDAARSFAMAVADLKASSNTVQSILDRHGAELSGDREALERVLGGMETRLDAYSKAQDRLLGLLFETPPDQP